MGIPCVLDEKTFFGMESGLKRNSVLWIDDEADFRCGLIGSC